MVQQILEVIIQVVVKREDGANAAPTAHVLKGELPRKNWHMLSDRVQQAPGRGAACRLLSSHGEPPILCMHDRCEFTLPLCEAGKN